MMNEFNKLLFILKNEKNFFIVTITYGLAISLLTLGVPISLQALINTITFGVLYQPLVVISMGLLVVLFLSGILKGLQVFTIEMFQRHFFARTVSEISMNLIEGDKREFQKINGVELVNRYFEIMTIQKKVSLLLTDFFSIVLQTIVGLVLIAFYHPYFLVFDIALIVMLICVWWFWGKSSIKAAISESKAKYQVANWLQETARFQLHLQTRSKMHFFAKRADDLIQNYLQKRTTHFNFLFTQIIFLLAIYAFFSALILGGGGYLVVIGELSIGQLVAVELIVTVVLASIAKSGKYFESFYDLVAAIEKLHHFYELKKKSTLFYKDDFSIETIEFRDVFVNTLGNQFHLNFKIGDKDAYYFHCQKNSGKSIFIDLIFKFNPAYHGQILINDEDIKSTPLINLNEQIMMLDQTSNFQGSIEDNLNSLGQYSLNEISNVLQEVSLNLAIEKLDQKEQTILLPSDFPFWPSEALRFEIAKILLQKPKFLILSERFKQIDDFRRGKILILLKKMKICLIFMYEDSLAGNVTTLNVDFKD